MKDPPVPNRGIFLFPAFLILFLLPSFYYSQAKLQITDGKKSFGNIKKGEVVSLQYEIVNAGSEPLIIIDTEVACSCTTVDFPRQPIAPGQGSKITVQFNTSTVYGRQDRRVSIRSNDPKGPGSLRFKGYVSQK